MDKQPGSFVILLAVLLLLTGCGESDGQLTNPTLAPLARLSWGATPTPTFTPQPEIRHQEVVESAGATVIPVVPAAGLLAVVPTPDGPGVRPHEAEQLWVPDAGPAPPEEWRPPPMPVPLSLHPDDHYWLIRPLPSGSRNYDLEWYPFGNYVLLPHLDPYRVHHGIDFPNETGTPVLAAGSGAVIHAGVLPSPRDGVNYYGNTVIIHHDWQWQGQNVYTLYAHTLELFVRVGDQVQTGQLLAGVGSSGEVSGPHLHFEVRIGSNTYGHARNPALWLAPFEGWGTLAGRFVDQNGRMISDANVQVRPLTVDATVRNQRTYHGTIRSDDVWQENFVVADLPAGQYELRITSDHSSTIYTRQVEVLPGQTSFEVIQAEFSFFPTPTPFPTPEIPEESEE